MIDPVPKIWPCISDYSAIDYPTPLLCNRLATGSRKHSRFAPHSVLHTMSRSKKKEAGSSLNLKKKPPLQHGWAPFVSAYFYPQTQVSLDLPVTNKACTRITKIKTEIMPDRAITGSVSLVTFPVRVGVWDDLWLSSISPRASSY